MILTVDIGNTSITLGGFENNILKFVFRIKSDRNLNVDGCCEQLKNQFKKHNVSFEHLKGCIISSVVPILTPIVFDSLKQILKHTPFLIEDFSCLPLKISEYDTSNLGTDRIINCIAALKNFKPPIAIFDMGTATTLSVINKNGYFCGGMILPGMELSMNALSKHAAKLPKIFFEKPRGIIGKDTISCMQNGALYGAAGSIEGIIKRLEEELNETLLVVLTGGLSSYVIPLLKCQVKHEQNLQLFGLYEVYKYYFDYKRN